MAQTVESRMQVNEFKVSGNSLLTQTEVDAILAPFKGLRTLDELKQAALALQERYRKAGYGAVIAFVPEQTAINGTASIAVLEGRISRVEVTGNRQFSEDNIRRSLPALAPGRTPEVQLIDLQIQLANESPAKQVAVSLEPGQNQGEVEARVLVSESSPLRWTTALDNTGNASTGRLRANLGVHHAALWDLDHVLSLQFQFAPEELKKVAVYSASYRIPLYAQGMTLDAFLAHSNIDGGTSNTPAGPLAFNGRGDIAALRLNKFLPRLGEVDQRLSVGFDQRTYLNDCNIAGLPSGACGSAGESVTVQPLSVEYNAQRQGESPLSATLTLIGNTSLGGRYTSPAQFDAVRVGAKRSYATLRLNANGGFTLPDQWQIQARISSQYSPDALVSGEQFGLGGASSVRGYEEREFVGDSGVFASLELHTPNLSKNLGGGLAEQLAGLRALAFIDGGMISNQLGTPCHYQSSRCGIASAGLGLRLGARQLQLRLDVAQALRTANFTQRSDIKFHFQASYSFI
ncbi:ShlB/FhaC/HecB family hemolysin secretion/activation protein [Roseateles oligotrophus]|uniref:BamA/TamA family outer membrane protein n=1 Tax=Roseateles oligotrophus TaxID=1769250 RepID=A0ABT2YMK6_9BURK|nr:ShlB/FhaC/HecB family hemolysin secretion/activation protein [Roseateles oligotrophus]MCV2371297.1 BamA/TamA family outer membrane protein [Roseateles oligotrophus]